MPGHERFIKNMLAGVGAIDLALLIVAADESDLDDKVEERTKGDAVRLGCKDAYDGRVLFILQTEELPTAKKY